MVTAWLQRSSTLSIALILSLGANLFFAGWLLGGRSVARHVPPLPPIEHFGEEIGTSLSPEGAAIMEAAFAEVRKRFGSHVASHMVARDHLKSVLTAEHFNPADFISASESMRAERSKDRTAADEEVARAIAKLSAEDRRRLAEIRPHRPPGGGKSFGFLK